MKTMFESISLLERALTFHRERHSVLAGNLANLDTPGYQPVDLAWHPEAPSPTGEAGDGSRDHTVAFVDPSPHAGSDGNAVNLEREMAKIAANKTRFSAAAELTSRRLALLRYGATDGNG